MSKASQQDRADAIAKLRDILPPGSTVYTILRHVSRSGVQKLVDVYAIQDGVPRYISFWVAQAIGANTRKHRGSDPIVTTGYEIDIADDIAWALRDPETSTVPRKLFHSCL